MSTEMQAYQQVFQRSISCKKQSFRIIFYNDYTYLGHLRRTVLLYGCRRFKAHIFLAKTLLQKLMIPLC